VSEGESYTRIRNLSGGKGKKREQLFATRKKTVDGDDERRRMIRGASGKGTLKVEETGVRKNRVIYLRLHGEGAQHPGGRTERYREGSPKSEKKRWTKLRYAGEFLLYRGKGKAEEGGTARRLVDVEKMEDLRGSGRCTNTEGGELAWRVEDNHKLRG